jgi:acyl-CoA synthetase (AMP-forming)/AMP-acid ligase II
MQSNQGRFMNFGRIFFLVVIFGSALMGCMHAPMNPAATLPPNSQRSVADIRINGIVCIAPARNGINPMLIIRDISAKQATLLLNLDGDIPDTRNSFIQKSMQNSRVVAGYVSDRSHIDHDAPKFSFYTDGSTKEDTTKGILSFEDGRPDMAMQCKNGMAD